MSTRGVIARLIGAPPVVPSPQFFGRYHHWDSYPSGLGHTLWELYHEQFHGDLEAMSWVLIDEHPAGWSTINGADFRLTAGFTELVARFAPTGNSVAGESRPVEGNSQEDAASSQGVRPECYCHGDRSEAAWNVTEKNAASSGCEWAYAFVRGNTPQHDIMVILSSFRPSGRKMIGYFGQGDPKSVWQIVAVIGLQGQEPDWEALNRASPLKPPKALKTLGAVESASNGTGSRRRAASQTQTQNLAKPDAQARFVARERQNRGLRYTGSGTVVFAWEADTPTLLFLPQSQQLSNDAGELVWGDEDSDSTRLALAILLDFTADAELALQHHQSFQQRVIAPLSRDQRFWCLTAQHIQSFLESSR